jgi:S-DNA-T family DNA segregation ATPase FtsK/SpoIIIE
VVPERIENAGGVIGAYTADLLLFVFGISAYWWVVLCGALVLWGFRRIETELDADRRSYAVVLVGFVVLLLASCGLESLRLYTLKALLPGSPGGALGALVGTGLAGIAGFTGATLLLLALFAAGLSLFTGTSWLAVIEHVGGWTERFYDFVVTKLRARMPSRTTRKKLMPMSRSASSHRVLKFRSRHGSRKKNRCRCLKNCPTVCCHR